MQNSLYCKTIYILFKKELSHYFNSPIAYIFIGVFLIVGNWLFFNSFFLIGQASMRNFFMLLPWIFLFLAPALTMRLWSEEKKTGTDEFLLTLPITDWQAVLAKFLGGLAFLFVALLCSATIGYLGDIDLGPIIGGYIGALFLGGSYLAIGLFISSLTKNQIISFILSIVACFAAFIIGAEFVIESSPKFLQGIMRFLGLGNHFSNIARGVIDSKDVIYYFSFTFLFLWLNVLKLEARNKN